MDVNLVLLKKDGSRKIFPLPSSVTVIGRRHDCDLCIPLTSVSRRHCQLSTNGQTLRIRDLGSHNGTYLNSNRVNEEVVQPGDIVKIGPLTFIIQINGHPDIPVAGAASDVRKLSQKDISAGDSSLENLETSAGLDNINFDDINPPK